MENEAYKVRHFLEGVAACGAAVALRTIQPQHDMITQRKAFAFFAKEDAKYGGNHGEAWVLEQVRLGNLHPKRKGKAKKQPPLLLQGRAYAGKGGRGGSGTEHI